VEVALGGGAVAEVREGDALGTLQPLSPGQAHRVHHVAPDRDRRRQHVEPLRRAPTPLVTGATEHEEIEGIAVVPHGSRVPVRRHHPVVGLKGGGTADLGRLLPLEWGVGCEPALELQGRSLAVVGARRHHPAVELGGLVKTHRSVADQVTERRQDLQHLLVGAHRGNVTSRRG